MSVQPQLLSPLPDKICARSANSLEANCSSPAGLLLSSNLSSGCRQFFFCFLSFLPFCIAPAPAPLLNATAAPLLHCIVHHPPALVPCFRRTAPACDSSSAPRSSGRGKYQQSRAYRRGRGSALGGRLWGWMALFGVMVPALAFMCGQTWCRRFALALAGRQRLDQSMLVFNTSVSVLPSSRAERDVVLGQRGALRH